MPFNSELLDGIIESHQADPVHIIAMLQDIQEHFGYLPREAFHILSARLKMSEAKIYSIATFYENFSLEPKGKYVIRVCDGTACHVRKSVPILERLKKELNLPEGRRTTDDLLFTLETVSCLGACGLAPVLMVNDKVYPAMTPDSAAALLDELRKEQ